MIGRISVAIGPAAGALLAGNRTAGVILAAGAAAVVLLATIGAGIDALPEWTERWEKSRDLVSKGRHRRKRRKLGGRP
jgi:hypothetical protein